MINLRPVDRTNWKDCNRLSVLDSQRGLVATNAETIAESKFESHFHLRAICDDETVVGMLAFCHENAPEDLELYWIFRLMIGHEFQSQGYAFKAMELAIHEISQLGAKRIQTMHKPANKIAAALYEKLGFVATGIVLDDGDAVLEVVL